MAAMNLTKVICMNCTQVNYNSARALSFTRLLQKAYEQWPYEKVRRVGRKPNAWRGQGGKKSRIAYDKRFALSGKDINETTEGLKRGGNDDMRKMIGAERAKSNPAVLTYYDYIKEREITEIVPEMIPEFVVPDLTNFHLKPYVSYRVDKRVHTQPKHTPAQLYTETYQQTASNGSREPE